VVGRFTLTAGKAGVVSGAVAGSGNSICRLKRVREAERVVFFRYGFLFSAAPDFGAAGARLCTFNEGRHGGSA
jgi:hypothetical protein